MKRKQKSDKMEIFERIYKNVVENNLIVSGDKIVVGFSGGPDSVFLAVMLKKLCEKIDFEFCLVHINHLLRGEFAQRDEDFSKDFGKENKLDVYTKKIDVEKIAREKNLTFEEGGRLARYEFYREILARTKSNKIALAHNKDDQIETFLFRLIRGTGISGLNGIISKDDIIRPINEIYKDEILKYLDDNKIKYCIDHTNFENEYTRNSIRLDLIPFIEKRYNPKFKDKIYSLMEEIRDVNRYIDGVVKGYEGQKELEVDKLLSLSFSLRGRVLANYLYSFGVDVSRKKLDLVAGILEKGGSQEIGLDKGHILKKEYKIIKVEKRIEKDREVEDSSKILKIPGAVNFGEYTVEATYEEYREENKNRNCFYTNLKGEEELIVRKRAKGDRIVLGSLSKKIEKKVKDIFINEKIPKSQRDTIPLVVCDDKIIWIAGVRGSSDFAGTQKKCVKLSVRRTK